MRALLVHQGLDEALKGMGGLPAIMSDQEKKTLMEKAHSAIILSLGVRFSEKSEKKRLQLEFAQSSKPFT